MSRYGYACTWLWLVLVLAAGSAAFGQQWVKVNGGNYVDAGEALSTFNASMAVSTLHMPNGDLLYFFHSLRVGEVMGRFRAGSNRSWQLWTPAGWSGAADLTPLAASGVLGGTYAIQAYPDPDPENPRGIIGTFTEVTRSGAYSYWDNHDLPTHFVFRDGQFLRWNAPGLGQPQGPYDAAYATSLIRSWDPNTVPDFAFDPDTGSGVLVGLTGWLLSNRFQTQITATRYDHAKRSWQRWNGNGWHTNNEWPAFWSPDECRPTFLLGPDVDIVNMRCVQAQVTRLPSPTAENYLVTFAAQTTSSQPWGPGGHVKACRYSDYPAPHWEWLGTNGWRDSGASDDDALQGIGYGTGRRRQVYWPSGTAGSVMVVQNDGTWLREYLYDAATGAFNDPAQPIDAVKEGTPREPNFCLAADAGGTLWLVHTRTGHEVLVRYRAPNASVWSDPQPDGVFVDPVANLSPVALDFVTSNGHAKPVVFVAETTASGSTSTTRLFAITPPSSFWNDETPMAVAAPPAPAALDPAALTPVKRVTNGAPGRGQNAADSMAVDSDGYVYAPQTGQFSVIAHPPTGQGVADNHAWGNFDEFFGFPGGAAVDRQRGKVYVPNWQTGPAGTGFQPGGAVSVWDKWCRTDSFAPNYDGWRRDYYPALISSTDTNGLLLPADASVDEARGLLYVSEGLRHRIDVWRIAPGVDAAGPFLRDDVFTNGIAPVNTSIVAAIVDDLAAEGLLAADPGSNPPTLLSPCLRRHRSEPGARATGTCHHPRPRRPVPTTPGGMSAALSGHARLVAAPLPQEGSMIRPRIRARSASDGQSPRPRQAPLLT